jgi:hypothetical protein
MQPFLSPCPPPKTDCEAFGAALMRIMSAPAVRAPPLSAAAAGLPPELRARLADKEREREATRAAAQRAAAGSARWGWARAVGAVRDSQPL